MLIVMTHIALFLWQNVWCETTDSGILDKGEKFDAFQSRRNASMHQVDFYSSASPMKQCIGVMRGVLVTAGIHLEPRVMAIRMCPLNTKPEIAALCHTDVHVFPSELGPVVELQNQMLSKLNTSGRKDLGIHLNLALRRVSPVVDADSGDIYANIYCAQCHNISSNKRIKNLSKQLFCGNKTDSVKCFVSCAMPKEAQFCSTGTAIPRLHFTWDSIFTIPEEDEEEAENSPKESIFVVLQWICCVFSMIALMITISVFSTSTRLRRPLPGKMMIALCCTLLGSLVAFLLASGVMNILSTPLRPMCVIFACLLQLLLLAAFVWMTIFAMELFRTFGLSRMFQHALRCDDCRKKGNRTTNAASMMLRARGSDSNPNSRFKHQITVATVLPLCITIPALVINEYAFSCLQSLHESTSNISLSSASQEVELGFPLNQLNPAFCPADDPKHAWFKGHYVALLIWFLGPAGVMISFNLLALIIVCIQICRLKPETRLSPRTTRQQLRLPPKPPKSSVAVCTKLTVILGASWFVQLLAGLWPQLEALRKVAGLANSAQGGIIAVSMLASSKARRAMVRLLPLSCHEVLGISETNSRSIQEITLSAKSRSRLTGQTNSLITNPNPLQSVTS